MINFFKKPNKKIFDLKNLDRETLLYRVLPKLLLEIMSRYFRLHVEGADSIPRRGPVIIAPNHSGYSGFDAVILGHVIQDQAKRIPRVLTHHFWFLTPTTAIPAQKMGFTEATFDNGLSALRKKNVVVIFPEGENGNFKPTKDMYELREFRRGFIRMALETGAPIVPTVIIGAEETHINLSQLKFSKFLRGTVLPLPLNIIPLPVKWRIHFLEPIYLPFGKEKLNDRELIYELAQEVQDKIQFAIREELKKRGSAFL